MGCQCGDDMSLALVAISFILLLFFGYRFYGHFISEELGLDDKRITPSHNHRDGRDFVPTKPFYLFAQHFSAIAAAGPIAGPIIACTIWGWLPCLLWIALGVVLIGAVHDFLSLTASVRHRAASIAEVAKDNLGPRAGLAMMVFIWLALVYVIVAFTDITAGSLVGASEELSATNITFNAGGAVAMAVIIYLTLAIIMGLLQHYARMPLWLATAIFVPATVFSIIIGTEYSTVLLFDVTTWSLLILAYCLVSSLFPVWLLLQPRGYLGGFFLYLAMAVGIVGMLFGGYEIKQAAFITPDDNLMAGALFPFLFVTIACGACSGFHGLVCSGTTAKQIDKESDMKMVAYGGMLCEAIVALIALATVMIWSPNELVGLKPGAIYGKGIGEFLSLLIGKEHLHIAITFGAMAFSTFVFDTLDVATRLGRYLLQELFKSKSGVSALIATVVTIAIPALFIVLAEQGSYLQFWSLFGASNQLMAALTLLSVTMWLYRARRRISFTLLPMLFVLSVTTYALIKLVWHSLVIAPLSLINLLNGLVSLLLLGLAIYLVIAALIKIRTTDRILDPAMPAHNTK